MLAARGECILLKVHLRGWLVRWSNAHNTKKPLREGQGIDLFASGLIFTFQDSGRRGKRTQCPKVHTCKSKSSPRTTPSLCPYFPDF